LRPCFWRRPEAAVFSGAAEQSPRDDEDGIAAAAAREGDDLIRLRPFHSQRPVAAASEYVFESVADRKQPAGECELNSAALPLLGQRHPIRVFVYLCERRAAGGEVDRATVIGIDQSQIPEFRALIKVRHAGHHRFQGDLGETIERAQQRGAACDGFE
jgi:hypothetical protein